MYEKNVARGSAWLDKTYPGWHKRIDLERLDVFKLDTCVLGQTMGGGRGEPWMEIRRNSILAENRGFIILSMDYDSWIGAWRHKRAYARLTRAWKQEIIRRRQVEAMMEAAIKSVKLWV